MILKKNGVQAMVELDGVESARWAKQSLNGADVYSDCCSLRIEFIKPSYLNVKKMTMKAGTTQIQIRDQKIDISVVSLFCRKLALEILQLHTMGLLICVAALVVVVVVAHKLF